MAKYVSAQARGFMCPICLQTFPDTKNLNKAHLWPEALGGRIYTLACQRCNADIGTRIEKHEVERVKYLNSDKLPFTEKIEGVAGHIGLLCSIRDVDGQPCLIMEISEKHSNPRTLAENRRMFDTKEILRKKATLSFRSKFNERKADLTYLHFAYMTLFHKAGYGWVTNSMAHRIRRQLANPEEISFPIYVVDFPHKNLLGDSKNTEPALVEVSSPVELQGYFVVTPEPKYEGGCRKAIWIPNVFDEANAINGVKDLEGLLVDCRFLARVGNEPGGLAVYKKPT